MPEGVAVAGGPVVSGAVHDNPDVAPPPGPQAPKGWAWNRTDKAWKPRLRGPVLWQDPASNPYPDPPAQQQGGGYPWFGKGRGAPVSPDPRTFEGGPDGMQQLPPEQQGRDPAPGWMSPEPQGRHRKLSIEQVPKQVQDDIAGMAGLVGTPILALARSIDPYCGGALADNFEGVIDATLPLICRSEKIVKYFSEDTADWLLWGKLAMALAPVGKAIAEHHVFHTVEVVRLTDKNGQPTGAVEIRRTTKDGDGLAQHLTPPAADPQAYAA